MTNPGALVTKRQAMASVAFHPGIAAYCGRTWATSSRSKSLAPTHSRFPMPASTWSFDLYLIAASLPLLVAWPLHIAATSSRS